MTMLSNPENLRSVSPYFQVWGILQLGFHRVCVSKIEKRFVCKLGIYLGHHPAHRFLNLAIKYVLTSLGCEESPNIVEDVFQRIAF